jgi:hypothetical protein
VAVTGGTSVSWGETQLAHAVNRQRVSRAVPILAGVIVCLGALGLALTWKSTHSTTDPVPSSAPATSLLPDATQHPEQVDPEPTSVTTSAPTATASTAKQAAAAPSTAPSHKPIAAGGSRMSTSAPVTASPATTSVVRAPPTSTPTEKPHDDLPTERQ